MPHQWCVVLTRLASTQNCESVANHHGTITVTFAPGPSPASPSVLSGGAGRPPVQNSPTANVAHGPPLLQPLTRLYCTKPVRIAVHLRGLHGCSWDHVTSFSGASHTCLTGTWIRRLANSVSTKSAPVDDQPGLNMDNHRTMCPTMDGGIPLTMLYSPAVGTVPQ